MLFIYFISSFKKIVIKKYPLSKKKKIICSFKFRIKKNWYEKNKNKKPWDILGSKGKPKLKRKKKVQKRFMYLFFWFINCFLVKIELIEKLMLMPRARSLFNCLYFVAFFSFCLSKNLYSEKGKKQKQKQKQKKSPPLKNKQNKFILHFH